MKTKILFLALLLSFSGLIAQEKDRIKMQSADEKNFIQVDKAPALISQLKPEYPREAKLQDIQGKVFLKLLIDEKGNVAKAKVEKGVNPLLDKSALSAAKKAKFSPALINDKPVKVWVVLPIAFKLDAEKKNEADLVPQERRDYPVKVETAEPGMNEFVAVQKLPEMISSSQPYYPELAKKAGIEGKVFVKVLVDEKGNPKKAVVIKSESDVFNQSATEAAMKSKFTPAINEGKPIAVWIVLPYRFTLGDKQKEKGDMDSFNTPEEADRFYKGYTDAFMHPELASKRGNVSGDYVPEKIESNLSYGDESTIIKITKESKTRYFFVARKNTIVYKINTSSMDDIKKYVEELKKRDDFKPESEKSNQEN